MNIKKIFLSSLVVCGIVILAISFFIFAISSNVSAEDISEKLLDKEYQDSLRTIDSIKIPNDDSTLFKTYDVSERKIIIEDDKYETIIELKLLSNYEQNVGIGTDIKVAEFLIIEYNDLEIFDKIDFYSINDNYEKETKQFELKYAVESIVENCYEKELFNNKTNESLGFEEICYDYSETNWEELRFLKEFPVEGLRVGLFTDTVLGEHIEWVPTIGGFESLEWASYLVTDLTAYWKLDGTSDPIVDSHSTHNGSNSGATPNVAGLINTAYDFDGGTDSVNFPDSDDWQFTDFTISSWVNYDNFGTWWVSAIVAQDTIGGANNKWLFSYDDGTDKLVWMMYNGGLVEIFGDAVTVNTGTWYHMVVTRSGNDFVFYLDGVAKGGGSSAQAIGASSQVLTFGKGEGASGYLDGTIDEVGIWSRALNSTEVSDLYNSGDGFAYPFEVLQDCVFNGTVKDGDGIAINGAKIVIANLEEDTLKINTTSDASGLWDVGVDADGNYSVYAYRPNNITGDGDIFTYVECIREMG